MPGDWSSLTGEIAHELWRAVLVQTLKDAATSWRPNRGTDAHPRQALAWLHTQQAALVCEWLELDHTRVLDVATRAANGDAAARELIFTLNRPPMKRARAPRRRARA